MSENALEFFSREAGQRRRAWLDRQGDRVANALSYYLGPGAQPVNALAQAMQYSDAGDFMEAGDASRGLWNEPSLQNAARFATAGAALAVPIVSARMMREGVDVVGDAARSFGDDARRFAADEDGAIRAFHGSPHDFDRFSMDKIGTGEGAQAYGHGLYFADSEDVARSYRDALAPGMGDGALRAAGVSDGDLRAMRQFTQSGVDPDIALRDWLGWTGKRETPELRAAFMQEWSGRNTGRMYEVNINANPEDFLDWDLPLAGQTTQIQNAIRQIAPNTPGMASGQRLLNEVLPNSATPYTPAADRARHAATERLREAGIPGIRYLDAGSRAAGDGSRNYVVFDENLIEIVRKYGIAGAASILGMSAADVQAAIYDQSTPPRAD